MDSPGGAMVDFGRWVTGFLVVMGVGELGLSFLFWDFEDEGEGEESRCEEGIWKMRVEEWGVGK